MSIVFLQGASELLNPLSDRRIIEEAYAADAAVARAEYGGEFREDISAYLPNDIIDAALCPGERSRSRLLEYAYVGFVDAAGGGAGGDAMTCAVAHQDERGRLFVDQLVAVDGPFDVETAVSRCALVLKAFGLVTAQADRYAGQWPAQAFQRHGINLLPCELTRSQIYSETAPLFMGRLVSLIDDPRLEVELRGLERSPKSGGRPDSIDHGRGAHDDRINAVCGALWLASKQIAPGLRNLGGSHIARGHSDYDPLQERSASNNQAAEQERLLREMPPELRPTIYFD
jgi:hypothetical protein